MITLERIGESNYMNGTREEIVSLFNRACLSRSLGAENVQALVIGTTVCMIGKDARGDRVSLFMHEGGAFLSVARAYPWDRATN